MKYYEDDICCNYDETKKEWTIIDARECDEVEVANISSISFEVEYLTEEAKNDVDVNKYIEEFLGLVADKEFRYISLMEGTCMGDSSYVFKTNAPIRELRELEKICCDILLRGGDYGDIPIWADILETKGYVFDFIGEFCGCLSVDNEKYPYVIEHYTIETQPNILIERLYKHISRNISNSKDDIESGRIACILGKDNNVYFHYFDETNSVAIGLESNIVGKEELKDIIDIENEDNA